MRNKHVVITGGAGFIGSNLAYELASENTITVIDDLSTGHLKNIQLLVDNNNIEFIVLDNNSLSSYSLRCIPCSFEKISLFFISLLLE